MCVFEVALRHVSILVVVDRARWASEGSVLVQVPDEFQSLLWWIGLAGEARPESGRSLWPSFNPCCGGSGSLGTVANAGSGYDSAFQSLLWWIGLAGLFRKAHSDGPDGVSILVVVDRARWAAPGCSRPHRCKRFNPCCGGSGSLGGPMARRGWWQWGCFNPCCGGSGSLGGRVDGCRCRLKQVSILVVVDRARWDDPSKPDAASIDRFQSLLWWIGLAGADSTAITLYMRMVSILVVVDRARWGGARLHA